MGGTLYLCQENGDIYRYFPEKEDSSGTIEAYTSFLFTAFNGTKEDIEAFACGYNVNKYIDEGQESESSVLINSESSGIEEDISGSEDKDEVEPETVFYIVRKEEFKEYSTLSCYNFYGELISEFDLQISEKILGLEVWPKDGNTVVATSSNNVYVIDLRTSPPYISFSESARKLTKGLAYKAGSGNEVYFWAGLDQGEFYKRGVLSINKNTADNNLIAINGGKISREILGFTNLYDRLHLSFSEVNTPYPKTTIFDPSGSNNLVIPVAGIDIASPVSACAYLSPYEEKYFEIETSEYDSTTGSKKGLSTFGAIASGSTSNPKIIRLKVPWAKKISNIKLGLVDEGLINGFQPGVIKIGTSPVFSTSDIPSEYFQGINTTDLSDDEYNISIPNSNENSNFSDYVYLSISLPERYFGSGIFKLKWFFDFEAEEEELLNIPKKICPEGEYERREWSSESSMTSDLVCEAGTCYFNDAVDPIVFEDGVYTWSGGSWDTHIKHANIQPYCRRILIYDNVSHDGTTYLLNSPHIIAPWRDGFKVPNWHPFKTPCWNYSTYRGSNPFTPPYPWTLGGNITFTINPIRLFQNLIIENRLEIPAGAKHTLALEVDTYALLSRKPGGYVTQGRIKICPMAYYRREEFGRSSSSSKSSYPLSSISSKSSSSSSSSSASSSSSTKLLPSSHSTISSSSPFEDGTGWVLEDHYEGQYPILDNFSYPAATPENSNDGVLIIRSSVQTMPYVPQPGGQWLVEYTARVIVCKSLGVNDYPQGIVRDESYTTSYIGSIPTGNNYASGNFSFCYYRIPQNFGQTLYGQGYYISRARWL